MVDHAQASLLPCPFCGCAEINQEYDNVIRCTNSQCDVEMDWGHFTGPTAKEAMAKAWNTRAALTAHKPGELQTAETGTSQQGATIDALPQWRPIETAPKGRIVLTGWFNGGGKWRSEHGRYYGPKELALDDYASEDSVNDEDYAPAGWYGGGLDCESLYDIRPTHWMPLPAAPQ